MKVISVNIGKKKKVIWNGKEIETGIYKYPVNEAIFLGVEDVEKDDVVDRKYHGGIHKACYAYSSDTFAFWQNLYPHLKIENGIFGENLTVEGLDETEIKIGNQYQVGSAIIEVSQPRQPCFKLGIRFEDQGVLKHFVNASFSGVYFRVIKPGSVASGSLFELVKERENEPTVAEVHAVKFQSPDQNITKNVKGSQFIADAYFK